MSNIPDRVVLRVARDPDKDDKDKDKDKSSSSSTDMSATATPTSQPKPPGPPGPPRPESGTSTIYTVIQAYTGTPDPTATSIKAPPKAGDHFGPAESAGIGVGVAGAVLILALAAWLFVRRRRSSKMRKISVSSVADTETGSKDLDSGCKEYGPPGVRELEAERRASELAAHMEPVEVVGDPEFVAELQGSDAPVAGWRKPDRERLFADAPINEEGDHDENGFSKFDGEKLEPHYHKESGLSKIDDQKREPDGHGESDLSKMDVKKKDS